MLVCNLSTLFSVNFSFLCQPSGAGIRRRFFSQLNWFLSRVNITTTQTGNALIISLRCLFTKAGFSGCTLAATPTIGKRPFMDLRWPGLTGEGAEGGGSGEAAHSWPAVLPKGQSGAPRVDKQPREWRAASSSIPHPRCQPSLATADRSKTAPLPPRPT